MYYSCFRQQDWWSGRCCWLNWSDISMTTIDRNSHFNGKVYDIGSKPYIYSVFDLLIDLTMSFQKKKKITWNKKIVIINEGVVEQTEPIAFSSYKSFQYTQTSRQSLEISSFWLLPMHKGEIFQKQWRKNIQKKRLWCYSFWKTRHHFNETNIFRSL